MLNLAPYQLNQLKDLSAIEEKQLLYRLQKGDYRAFELLYDKYRMLLMGKVFRLVKSEELTADIIQDLFLKIWNNRENVDPEKSFRSFLYKISENLVFDFYRKAARDRELFRGVFDNLNTQYDHVEEYINKKDVEKQLQHVLDILPPQCRKVYLLFKFEGKSYQEISDMLGISLSAVNNHITKANNLIKKHFPSENLVALYVVFSFLLNKS